MPTTALLNKSNRCRRISARALIAIALGAIFAIPISFGGTVSAQTASPMGYTEMTGVFDSIPPGQPWRIRVPKNWNGILLSDMDYANDADGAKYLYFLQQGYAESGIQRVNPYRMQHYDPAREIADLVKVINIFKDNFGKPRLVIQMGVSGGGNVTVSMADYADHFGSAIDGALAWAPHEVVSYENQNLDRWFVLKMLLARQRTDLWPQNPLRPFSVTDGATQAALWQPVIDAAQATPEGRARIALAETISQLSLWATDAGCANGASPPCPELISDNGLDGTYPRPDAKDANSLETSMYYFIRPPESLGGFDGGARYQLEGACGGNLSWNTGVDYAKFFQNGNKAAKKAVITLYQEAGLSLSHDLSVVNAGPRVPQNPAVITCWSQPGRNVLGNPQVPLLRVDSIGDVIPVAHMQAYACLVRQNGAQRNYGALFMNHSGHTRGTLAEQAAALKVLVDRLETGEWHTNAESVNKIADALFPGTKAQFVNFESDPLGPVVRFNRTFTPAGQGDC